MHETGYFEGPYCEVGFLQWNKDYIFGLSISVASIWYEYSVGAITVPCPKVAPNFRKFVPAALYGEVRNRVLEGPYCEVGFLHWNKDYIFGLSIPVASFWYK